MSQPIATFTNEETGMESYVYPSDRGGYNVTLKDLDSGEFVDGTPVGIKDKDVALAKAKKIVGF